MPELTHEEKLAASEALSEAEKTGKFDAFISLAKKNMEVLKVTNTDGLSAAHLAVKKKT